MWPALLAGAGLGLGKSILVDQPQADKQRQLAATTARLSPWTGLTPDIPQNPNAFGAALEGASAGAMLGQGADKNAAEIAKLKAETDKMNMPAAMTAAPGAVQAQAPMQPKPFTPQIGMPQQQMPMRQPTSSWMDLTNNYVMQR